jgi:glutamine amidotransferase
MSDVAIIDYGLCNLDSIARAVEECGGDPVVTDDPSDVGACDRVILPGVGAYGQAMENLNDAGLSNAIREKVSAGAPMLGICLGMQLLSDCGTEFGDHTGLGLIPGIVRRLVPSGSGERVPHIGWNEVHHRRNTATLLAGIDPVKDFYFVHSYYFDVAEERDLVATTPFCGGVAAVVNRGKVWGTQFHPEKSQKAGFAVLRNFLSMDAN